ncbi:MAG: PQQ-binding-like beta-propeller repeat protein [Verrucomicrobiota bacterium]
MNPLSKFGLVLAGLSIIFLVQCSKQNEETSVSPKVEDYESYSWTSFRGGQEQHAALALELVGTPQLKWRYDMGGPVKSTAVVANGRLFLGSDRGRFVALSLSEGELLWEFQVEDSIEGAAALVADLVIFGDGLGVVYALDQTDGSEKWRFTSEADVKGGINFAKLKNGSYGVVFGSYDSNVYCLEAESGETVWTFETDNYVNGTPAISQDGRVSFGGCDSNLYIVDLNTGKELGFVPVDSYVASSVAIRDGVGYLGHYGNQLLAYDLYTQKILWEFKAGEFPFFASAAVSEDSLVIGSRGKKIYCLERDKGTVKWEFSTQGDVDSSAVIAKDLVIVGSHDGRLYGIDLDSGEEHWSYDLGSRITSSPVVVGQHVIIASEDGSVTFFSFKDSEA